MILESTQLLNNALIKHDKSYNAVYRQTHKNHPISIWTAESIANFDWLIIMSLELCKEYTFRYGKQHKCQSIIESFRNNSSRLKLPVGDMTPFKLCMPAQYKIGDCVESYRNYYKGAKSSIASWKNRPIPDWWSNF